MTLISINTGRPRDVEWRGDLVRTSIFKAPVAERVRVARLNVQGDEQADLTVHGGVDKAVYAYPSEHYTYWRHELPTADLSWGAFGENLTTQGVLETAVHIGDRFRIGSTEFAVTQPRMPCYKLGVRFNRLDMVKRFLRSGHSGFYLAVRQEGEIGAGDDLERIGTAQSDITVADVLALYTARDPDRDLLRRASELPSLARSWRDHFRERLEQM